MQRDFTLMHRAARLSSHLPFLSELHLEESIRQFGAPLKEQLDLLVEAQHLDRFGKNFRTWRNLSFPAPVYPLVAPSVLVETFEEGRLISSYVDKPTNKYSIQLANIGLSGYLQMLLKDNFVHADLHPGNILVRLVDPNTRWGRIATFLKVTLPYPARLQPKSSLQVVSLAGPREACLPLVKMWLRLPPHVLCMPASHNQASMLVPRVPLRTKQDLVQCAAATLQTGPPKLTLMTW